MSRTRTQIYDQIMSSAVQARWLMKDAEEGKFSSDEVKWLFYMREALISFHQFIEQHADDQDTKKLADAVLGKVSRYFESRLGDKGLKKRADYLKRQFDKHCARWALVERIMELGYNKTKACEKAVEIFQKTGHAGGYDEKGDPVDDATILKSHTRWEESGLPSALWNFPDQDESFPLPDPEDYLDKKR